MGLRGLVHNLRDSHQARRTDYYHQSKLNSRHNIPNYLTTYVAPYVAPYVDYTYPISYNYSYPMQFDYSYTPSYNDFVYSNPAPVFSRPSYYLYDNPMRTQFFNAVKFGDLYQVVSMLESNRSLLTARDYVGDTALIHAVNKGHYAVAEKLLYFAQQSGINILELQNNNRHTPFTIAVYNGNAQMVDLLLNQGANRYHCINSINGMDALFIAADQSKAHIIELLLSKGLSPNGINNRCLPLKRAVERNDHTCVKVLLDHGANTMHIDNYGRSVLDYAVDESMRSLIISYQHNSQLYNVRNTMTPMWSMMSNNSQLVPAPTQEIDDSVQMSRLGM